MPANLWISLLLYLQPPSTATAPVFSFLPDFPMISAPTSKACRYPVDNHFPSVPPMPPGSLLSLAIISWQKTPHAAAGSKIRV